MGSWYSISETEQVIVKTLTTEEVINGPVTLTYLNVLKKGTKKKASEMNEKQFIHVVNSKTGVMKLIKGPGLYFLKPFEQLTNDRVQDAIALKPQEYVKLTNKKSGAIRVERGEALVYLAPYEVAEEGVKPMVVVDETHACLIRDIRSGKQELITDPQMFAPTEHQVIVVPQQDLIVLKEYEVIVLVDKHGKFIFKHGWVPEEASFFVPPYHTVLKHKWTKTSFRKALAEGKVEQVLDEQRFEIIDIRHRFMPYAFVVRTHDNVEIILDIVMGWRIKDVEKMISKTKDTTNDICLDARSEIIEQVAKQPFRMFMQEVNAVVENAVLQADKTFFSERGIEVTSVQVEGFSCKHEQTERVLQETVQEATNKMNRVLKQETVNEVIKVEMEGKIREEELKKRVLEIQYEHEQIVAKTEGEAASKRVHAFLESLGDELSLEQKLVVFSLLEKKESIKQLANGSGVTLFCTPQDVNLNLAAFGGSFEQLHGKVLKLPQVIEKNVKEGKQEVQ